MLHSNDQESTNNQPQQQPVHQFTPSDDKPLADCPSLEIVTLKNALETEQCPQKKLPDKSAASSTNKQHHNNFVGSLATDENNSLTILSEISKAKKRSVLQTGGSPRKTAAAQQASPKRAITASNYHSNNRNTENGGVVSQKQSAKTKGQANNEGRTRQKASNKGNNGKGDGTSKGSAGPPQRKQNNSNSSAAQQDVKLLSSNMNTKGLAALGGLTGSNRSNSISRRSGGTNSSMAVNQANDSVTTQKKSKKPTTTLPKQKQANSEKEAKKEKPLKAPTEKQTAVNLEKAKIAEEIKLNVAAMGMDLLNNSSAAPTQVNKVNDLIVATSPKGLGLNSFQDQASDADDEISPERRREPTKLEEEKLSQKSKQDDTPAKNGGKFSIQQLQNSEESEDDGTLETGQRDREDQDEDDFTSRLKQSQFKHIALPPPLELIAKTTYKEEEPVKTGAPIAFVSIAQMAGGRYKTEELCGKKRTQMQSEGNDGDNFPVDLKPDVATLRASTSNIQQYMAAMNENGYVVYCRFGRDYITNMAKQAFNLINNPNLSQPMRQIATYLINVKKLVKEHNIESESKDFNKLKTTGKSSNMKKKNELPPTPYYLPDGPLDKTLVFESRFETGNLLCAMKVSDNEYDLVLANDINTNGHTQWFFFRVANTHKDHAVKFNILNLAKPDSLYNEGMRVLSFSQVSRDGPEQLSWHRVGRNISYYQNSFKREGNRFARCYYSLSFTHTFTESNDQVYFAHCFPYTYSDLTDDLSRIERDRFSQTFFNRSTLCRTLAGNRCEYITITSRDRDPNSDKSKAKKGVFISARVHPGESNASWMMKGVIDFLVSNTAEAQALRENFVFKIVPMLNPDGVINGNYRCSLAGQDLNRRWKIPSRQLHPVNWHVKKMVREFNKEREMVLAIDLHGHSRRKNIFMYGNNFDNRPHATRVFPFIMSKLLDFFSFEYSRFSVHKSKEATARVTLWRELKIPNVFTLEASFCGADKGQLKDKHFMPEHLMLAGKKILEALIVYTKLKVGPLKPNNVGKQDDTLAQRQDGDLEEHKGIDYSALQINDIEKELTSNKQLIEMTKGDEDGDDEGSDSEPSEDNLSEEEMAKIIPVKRKENASPNKLKKRPELLRKQSGKKLPGGESPSARGKQQPVLPRSNPTRSPIKRIYPYQNPYDRMMRRGIKKVEMVDAWTQTSPRASTETDEARKNRRQQPMPLPVTQHLRTQSNHHNGQIILTDNKAKPRSSVEHIYHHQQDAKSLQLQQDRRLAQIHRQSTQDKHKLVASDRQQFAIPAKGGPGSSYYPHTQNPQQHSAQLLQQSNNASPNQVMPPQNQIRIRKDPIKNQNQPGYKKPPSLAIYEETLLKQTGGVNPLEVKMMSQSAAKTMGIRDVNLNHLRSADPPDSAVKLPQRSHMLMQQDRPQQQQHVIHKESLGHAMGDQRGNKTFTATRLGNFQNQGQNDNNKQFFQYSDNKGIRQNSQSLRQQQQQQHIVGPSSINDAVPDSLSGSKAKRAYLNREQIYGLVSKEPSSPSKRSQNYFQAQKNLVKDAQRIQSPGMNPNHQVQQSIHQQQQSPLLAGNLNHPKVSMGKTRESFQFNKNNNAQQQDQVPLVGKPGSGAVQQAHLRTTTTSRMDNPSSRNSDGIAIKNGHEQNSSAQGLTSNRQMQPQQQQPKEIVTSQRIAEFRSNRNSSFRSNAGDPKLQP